MKCMFRTAVFVLFTLLLALPCNAEDKTYKIEVLQVAGGVPFQLTYDSFVKELGKQGMVKGRNLSINRTIIDFDVEKGGLWKKVGVLFRIKSEASRIVDARPDLVLTIGTPATKYAKDKIISNGIPLVFSNVAIPEAAGCKSLTEAGPGFTGTTLYMSNKDTFSIVKLAFPAAKVIGVVHSDDDNAISFAESAEKEGPSLGLNILPMQVEKHDSIMPAVQELIAKGAQAFIVPLDTYYGVRNNEPANDLAAISLEKKIPVISFMHYKNPGAALYVGAEFTTMGTLAGQQAAKILTEGVKAETLPILRQTDLTIMVDTKVLKALNLNLPMEVLQIAKSVE